MSKKVQARHAVRMDLKELFSRLERYTSLQSRVLAQSNPEQAENILITPGDYEIVNPLIKLAMADVADYMGSLVDFNQDGLDALTDWEIKDYLMKSEEEKAEKNAFMIAVYNLPGSDNEGENDHGQSRYTPAMHEFIFEAVAMHVIASWFKHLGFGNKAQMYMQEYFMRLDKARNAAPIWRNAPKRRKPITL